MYYALIMAGGSGTRLWPLSREKQPKQALSLVGERSMFQQAVDRIRPLFPVENILVVTQMGHAGILAEQTPELPAGNFLVEPEGRGTGPAIGLAAIHIRHKDPEGVMAVLTSDHHIPKIPEFCQALQAAHAAAEAGYLVTLGIRPGFPSTGFGYIEQGDPLGQANELGYYKVLRFTEKPDVVTAAEMLASGRYSWNSGMFIWKVSRVLEEFERQMPGFYAQLLELEAAIDTPGYQQVLERLWPVVKKQTIDYGVMEGAQRVAVFPVDIGWADVGSWGSLLDILQADEQGNICVGQHLGLSTSNCLIFGGQRMVATIGVQDLVIVDTPDALLVMAKDQEQNVKQVVERLKADGKANLV